MPACQVYIEDWKMRLHEHRESPRIEGLKRTILSRYPRAETVFLFGSRVEGTQTASSDLDVGVILNSMAITNPRPMPFVLEGTPVEIHVYHRAQLDDVETTAANPGFGSQLIRALPIHDPANRFTAFKDKFDEVYYTRPLVHRRIENSLTVARAYLHAAERHLSRGQPALVPGSIHQAVVSGIAMALFHQKQANPTQRRCLSSLEVTLTTAKEHDAYSDLLHLMGLDDADGKRATEAIALAETMHVNLTNNVRSLTPDLFIRKRQFYSASTRERIVDGARMLIRARNYPAALFCSMMLANASEVYAHLIPRLSPPAREEACASLTALFPFNAERGLAKAKALVKQVHDLI